MTVEDHRHAHYAVTAPPTISARTHGLRDDTDTLAVTPDEQPKTSRAQTPPNRTAFVPIARGPHAGSRFPLRQPTTSLGRHPFSDVYLDDITVSRRHAELRIDDTGVHIVDLDSLRGTHVNGTPVHAAELTNGDTIQIGKFRLSFFSVTS